MESFRIASLLGLLRLRRIQWIYLIVIAQLMLYVFHGINESLADCVPLGVIAWYVPISRTRLIAAHYRFLPPH